MAPRSDKVFFVLHLHLAGKYCKNTRVPGASLNVDPARAITWLVGAKLSIVHFPITMNSPPPRQFFAKKILLENNSFSRGNAH